jgi:hypothetical protein
MSEGFPQRAQVGQSRNRSGGYDLGSANGGQEFRISGRHERGLGLGWGIEPWL